MNERHLNKENETIYSSEESLLEKLRQTYPQEYRESMVDDGLCWAAISNELPDVNNNNWPECLWTESKRRVLFLLKEPMVMRAMITKIGIGQKVQEHLVMSLLIGLMVL